MQDVWELEDVWSQEDHIAIHAESREKVYDKEAMNPEATSLDKYQQCIKSNRRNKVNTEAEVKAKEIATAIRDHDEKGKEIGDR